MKKARRLSILIAVSLVALAVMALGALTATADDAGGDRAMQLAVMALGALTATACAQSQGSWTMKAPTPIARNEVALAAVGGRV